MIAAANEIEKLACVWLTAEREAVYQANAGATEERARAAAAAYETAVRSASREGLLVAWHAGLKVQHAREIGSAAWAEARAVSELIRMEYLASEWQTAPVPIVVPVGMSRLNTGGVGIRPCWVSAQDSTRRLRASRICAFRLSIIRPMNGCSSRNKPEGCMSTSVAAPCRSQRARMKNGWWAPAGRVGHATVGLTRSATTERVPRGQ